MTQAGRHHTCVQTPEQQKTRPHNSTTHLTAPISTEPPTGAGWYRDVKPPAERGWFGATHPPASNSGWHRSAKPQPMLFL